jgi:excisionase family DNA binding protein
MTENDNGDEGHRLLTPEELAECLGLSRKSVYRMAREGELPAYRFGSSWRFSLKLVLAHGARLAEQIAQSPLGEGEEEEPEEEEEE